MMSGYRSVTAAGPFRDQTAACLIGKREGFPQARIRVTLSWNDVPGSARALRQSGAVSGSVHSYGWFFSVVFGKFSVISFRRSTKQARLGLQSLKRARKPASLSRFGRRNSGAGWLLDAGPCKKGSGRGGQIPKSQKFCGVFN